MASLSDDTLRRVKEVFVSYVIRTNSQSPREDLGANTTDCCRVPTCAISYETDSSREGEGAEDLAAHDR